MQETPPRRDARSAVERDRELPRVRRGLVGEEAETTEVAGETDDPERDQGFRGYLAGAKVTESIGS
jgi:hypothetical protein